MSTLQQVASSALDIAAVSRPLCPSACWTGPINLAIDGQVRSVNVELTRTPGQDPKSTERNISYLLAGMSFSTPTMVTMGVQMVPLVTPSSVALSLEPLDQDSAMFLAQVCFKMNTERLCLSSITPNEVPLIIAALGSTLVLFVV